MLKEFKSYIKDHFKQLFSKTKKVPICKHCKYKISNADGRGRKSSWHCIKMFCKSICGKTRVKTSPKWCPLRKQKRR